MNSVFREIKVYDAKGFECRFSFFTLRLMATVRRTERRIRVLEVDQNPISRRHIVGDFSS